MRVINIVLLSPSLCSAYPHTYMQHTEIYGCKIDNFQMDIRRHNGRKENLHVDLFIFFSTNSFIDVIRVQSNDRMHEIFLRHLPIMSSHKTNCNY